MFYLFEVTTGGFYTGRAGDGWVMVEQSEAFGYESEAEAQRKADMFNKNRLLHSKRFEVVER